VVFFAFLFYNGGMNIQDLINESKAVLFDMDGVIIDSDSLHDEAKRGAVDFCGIQIEESEWQKIRHYTSVQIYDWLVEQYPDIKIKKEEFIAEKSRIFSEIAPIKIQDIRGAFKFVRYLKSKNIKTALVTASRKDTLGIVYQKFKLDDYFDVILTREDVENVKPDPEAYLKAAKLLEVRPEDCTVVEDAVLGVQSGKSAGCKVIGRASAVTQEVLTEAGADAVFVNYEELPN